MGKKKHEDMAKQKELFVSGAKGKGISEKLSEKLFDQMAFLLITKIIKNIGNRESIYNNHMAF